MQSDSATHILASAALLPLPQTFHRPDVAAAEAGKASSTEAPVESATEVVWVGEQDPRVAQRVFELLSDAPLGELRVEVMARDSGIPALGGDESYRLERSAGGIALTASSTWGALHGVATLWQLVCSGAHQGEWRIEDAPRFAWRGLLIDVARHFISPEVLRRVVDGMAKLKMNVLHLHLTDDQAFRFASASFPGLASEPSYSHAQLRQLVAYAADRGVRVVPELDVPGHVNSWLLNYPQWGGSQAVQPTIKFGVHQACLDPSSGQVYDALEVLFAELAEVFPDECVHIGGDEVHPHWWSEDDGIQRFMSDYGLPDTRALQTHFNHRVCAILAQLGKQALGWDEVLHPQMPPLVVQNWRGASTRDRALARSLDCIVSAGYYLDLMYGADVYYGYDPQASQQELFDYEDKVRADPRLAHVAAGLAWTNQWRDGAIDLDPAGQAGHVLGGEACLWSELVDDATLEIRLFSRLPAVAERLWSAREVCNIDDFYRRLQWVLTLPGLQTDSLTSQRLRESGLTPAQIEVASLLEPVKWYARLLGEQALQARIRGAEMPQARPYDSTSPLDRIVDFLSPESLAARGLAGLDAAQMRERCQRWTQLDPQAWPQDTQPAVRGMIETGNVMLAAMDATSDRQSGVAALRALYAPCGEYMLAVVPALIKWLANDREP